MFQRCIIGVIFVFVLLLLVVVDLVSSLAFFSSFSIQAGARYNSISASIHLLPHLQHTRPCQLSRKPRIPLRQKLTNLCACLQILDHTISCMLLQWRRPYGTILSRSMALSSNSPSSSKLYFFSDGKIHVIYYSIQRLLSRIQRNHSSISPQQLAVNTLHRCIHN